ncbi:biotin-dependent carboxyltransferase family protein [Palleronia abyssalis]|uniref:KipI antagonist n=1 Tax=Palleronia abyssalis TaxID=1501240 RepID=A0A2R8BWE0_9RHOB|nr:urea amidolyase [Palleronia abyssalis]SPJ24443.1 KipI antagonist [Palleronia abyssalis]
MTEVTILRAGPGVTVQDMGRPGFIAQGLSRGGAADRLAVLEAAALLGQPPAAGLELPPVALSLSVDGPTRIALTGSAMRAAIDDQPIAWNASHRIAAGQKLNLSPLGGGYGYVTFGGGIDTPLAMGARSAHLAAGLGRALQEGDTLPLGEDQGTQTDLVIDPVDRGTDRPLRLLPSAHTALFSQADRDRFDGTTFTRDARANRQGIRLTHDGAPFATEGQLSLISEIARPGDIQMTGEGQPYILGPECQTTGGYPRIGAIVPQDLPRAMQAPPGATFRFRFVDRDEALRDWLSDDARLTDLKRHVRPLTRDPRDIRNLAAYQLISGVTTGEAP